MRFGLFCSVLRYIAAAVIEGKLHGERTVRSKGGYGLLGIEDLDFSIRLDVAVAVDNRLADGFDVDSLGLPSLWRRAMMFLNIKNDLPVTSSLTPGDGRKLMLNACDLDRGRSRTGQ